MLNSFQHLVFKSVGAASSRNNKSVFASIAKRCAAISLLSFLPTLQKNNSLPLEGEQLQATVLIKRKNWSLLANN